MDNTIFGSLVIGFIFAGTAILAVFLGIRQGTNSQTSHAPQETTDDFLDEEAAPTHSMVGNLALVVLLTLAAVGFWPNISSQFGRPIHLSAETLEEVPSEGTPDLIDQPATPAPIASDVETTDWQVYQDDHYGYRLRYPQDWQLQNIQDTSDIQQSEEIIQAVEFTPTQTDYAGFSMRLHLEKNISLRPASSFASIHPARGEYRTPYMLFGTRAIKYRSVFLQTKQVRWTHYVPTMGDTEIIVVEFFSPVGVDDFDPRYLLVERIVSTLEPQFLVSGESSASE